MRLHGFLIGQLGNAVPVQLADVAARWIASALT
jgi:hypothetical protein